MNRDVPPTAVPLSMINYINANTPAFVPAGSGGGGGGGGTSTFTNLFTQALYVSSINDAIPGGSIPSAGISTAQVATTVGTGLSLVADVATFITVAGNDSGTPSITLNSVTGNVVLSGLSTLSGPISTSNITTSALIVSSINGAAPVSSGPTVSTYTYTVPLTLTPGVPTPMFSGPGSPFILTNNHLYTASWNVEWKNEGSGTTPTAGLQFFIGQTLAGDPGNIYSANAGISGANTNDGANDAFSLTWKQGVTDSSTNLYVQMVDVAPLANVSTTITAVGGALFTLTDWGVF